MFTFQFNDSTTTFSFIMYCICTFWMMCNTAFATAVAEREQEESRKPQICALITLIFVAWTITYGFLFDIIILSH